MMLIVLTFMPIKNISLVFSSHVMPVFIRPRAKQNFYCEMNYCITEQWQFTSLSYANFDTKYLGKLLGYDATNSKLRALLKDKCNKTLLSFKRQSVAKHGGGSIWVSNFGPLRIPT